ncbi:hypothetical protein SS50377_24816 [Spironucleus salmonicida]|uniref:Uncharacterized protein n=1 Tax=Spironucleus salmonicida TaxID=348837 RepID=V6LK86_9EUKA|nr:hypothetical protein SS50377_24816 [Spironucleus salmonicida]|eukprot:EST44738.1 Hypothetical protein SS50377_15358 [Spironucleus salmonicida]
MNFVPINCRLFPHFENGKFFCYGKNNAYNCDPTDYKIINVVKVEFNFQKIFNTFLTQPVFYQDKFYCTYDQYIFQINEYTLSIYDRLPFKTFRNQLVVVNKIILVNPYQFELQNDNVIVKVGKGILFQQSYKIFNFDQNTLTLLSPDFTPLEMQYVGELILYGSGQAVFKKNNKYILKSLLDNTEFIADNYENNYYYGIFGAIPQVSYFSLDIEYVSSKYNEFVQNQKLKETISTRIQFFVAENIEITEKIALIDEKWKQIDNEFNKTQVGLYGIQQELNELKFDIQDAVLEQQTRINELKKQFEVKLFKEKIGIK